MASLQEDRLPAGGVGCQRRNRPRVAAFVVCAGLVLALGGSALSTRALADEAQPAAAASEAVAYGTAVTKGWTQVDSCEWRVDESGCLVLRPLGGAAYGEIKAAPTENTGKDHEPVAWMSLHPKSFRVEGKVKVKSLANFFKNCAELETVDLRGLDSTGCTEFGGMFAYCTALRSADLTSLNASSARSIDMMFEGCSSTVSIDCSGWNTRNLQFLGYAFRGCKSLTSIKTAGWKLPKATDFSGVFEGDKSLTSLDLSGWDVKNAVVTAWMFLDCSSLQSVNLSGWVTPELRQVSCMFDNCSSLVSVDLSGWQTPILDAEWGTSFDACPSLREVKLGPLCKGFSLPIAQGSGLTGNWVDESGHAVSPGVQVPTGASHTYVPQAQYGNWVRDSCGWWWREANGSYPRSCWKMISGSWYHFDGSGYMQTGWQRINGSWYWLGYDGAMRDGWQKVNGSWYYLGESGAMVTGWQKLNNNWDWYYFGSDGAMRTGWLFYNGSWYWLDTAGKSEGKMRTYMQEIDGKTYYLGDDGIMRTGWIAYRDWYYFDASGAMVHDRWVGDYYLLSDGRMATNQRIDGYWVGFDGRWVPGK